MNEDKIRKEFEGKYPLPESVIWSDVEGKYIGLSGMAPWWLWQDRYEIWKASREALVLDIEHLYHATCKLYEEGRDDVVKLIHELGVKTKC
jgi:hypothetical protein